MGFFQGLLGPQGLQQLGPSIRERILRGRKEEREDLLLKEKREREDVLGALNMAITSGDPGAIQAAGTFAQGPYQQVMNPLVERTRVLRGRETEQYEQGKDMWELTYDKAAEELALLQASDPNWDWDPKNLQFVNSSLQETKVPDNYAALQKQRQASRGAGKLSAGAVTKLQEIGELEGAAKAMTDMLDHEKTGKVIGEFAGSDLAKQFKKAFYGEKGKYFQKQFPPEVSSFQLWAKHITDIVGRQRTGAAMPEAEQLFYKDLATGNLDYTVTAIRSRLLVLKQFLGIQKNVALELAGLGPSAGTSGGPSTFNPETGLWE